LVKAECVAERPQERIDERIENGSAEREQ